MSATTLNHPRVSYDLGSLWAGLRIEDTFKPPTFNQIETSAPSQPLPSLASKNKVEKIMAFEAQLQREVDRYSEYTKGFENIAFSKTFDVIHKIAKMSYEKASLEFTPDNSVFFKIIFPNQKKANIEIYFNPTGGEQKEAFFHWYENKQCVGSGVGSLSNVINEVSEIANNDIS